MAAMLEILIHGSSLILPAAIVFNVPTHPVVFAFALLLAFTVYVLGLMLLVGLATRWLPKPAVGVTREIRDMRRWSVLISLQVFLCRTPARWYAWLFPPGHLYYRLCGARIHPSVLLTGMDQIGEPYLIEVGEGSILGAGSALSGHYVPRIGTMVLGRVRIGKKVLLGRNAVVWPNVSIGDGAVVQERSSVMPGTVIPAGEVWGGIPAKPIRRSSPRAFVAKPRMEALPMPASNIQSFLLHKLSNRMGADEAHIDADTPLAQTGVLDSISFLALVSELEEVTGVPLDADILDYRTLTVNDLVRAAASDQQRISVTHAT